MSEIDINQLAERTAMLGQIANEVAEFCDHHDCTTLQAVKLMHAEILELRAYKIRREIWSTYED